MLQTREETLTFSLVATVQPALGGAPATITLNQHGAPHAEPGAANITQPVALATQNQALLAQFQQQTRWKASIIPGTMAAGTMPPDSIAVPLRCHEARPGEGGQRVTFGGKGYGPSGGGVWLTNSLSLAFVGEAGGGYLPNNDYTLSLTPDTG